MQQHFIIRDIGQGSWLRVLTRIICKSLGSGKAVLAKVRLLPSFSTPVSSATYRSVHLWTVKRHCRNKRDGVRLRLSKPLYVLFQGLSRLPIWNATPPLSENAGFPFCNCLVWIRLNCLLCRCIGLESLPREVTHCRCLNLRLSDPPILKRRNKTNGTSQCFMVSWITYQQPIYFFSDFKYGV